MSDIIKISDRVRATLGDSVLVGEVSAVTAFSVYMRADNDVQPRSLDNGTWRFERIASPIPEVEGTVVLDLHDNAWQRGGSVWWAAGRGVPQPLSSLPGPVRVVHTPEVQS